MKRLALVIALLAVAACSPDSAEADRPAVQSEAAAAPAETPAPAEEAKPAQPVSETDSIELAQAMDEAEEDTGDAVEEMAEDIAAQATQVAAAVPERFQEGRQYQLLTAAQPTSAAPGEVEVVEIFWYGCAHCYSLEPHVKAWLENGPPDATKFVRMHAALGRAWQVHARLYYTVQALGLEDQVHEAIFREIHVNRNPLNTEERMIQFFAQYGVDEAAFLEAWNSFAVQTQLRRADTQIRRFRVTSVPTVVVNGKYVTDVGMAGGRRQLFEVIDFLVEKESSGQG